MGFFSGGFAAALGSPGPRAEQKERTMKSALPVAIVVVCGCAASAWAHPPTAMMYSGAKSRASTQPSGGTTDSLPFSDNFDSYANGSNLGGQGTWLKWEPASVETLVSNAQSTSPSNSMKLVPSSDITQRGTVTSGKWELKCKTYWPSTNVGPGPNDGGFVIGLNQFDPVSPNTQPNNYWSAQIQWHPGTNTVRNYNLITESTAIVPNAWVEFRMVIDLTVDKWDAFYNNVQIVTQKPWSSNVAAGGTVTVGAFDFFSGNLATTLPFEMFFDDVTFTAVPTGCYPNCDNSTSPPILNALDFGCFLTKFAGGDTYANCDNSTSAPTLNALDFGCFLTKFAAGCT